MRSYTFQSRNFNASWNRSFWICLFRTSFSDFLLPDLVFRIWSSRTGSYRTGSYRTGSYRTGSSRTGSSRCWSYRNSRPHPMLKKVFLMSNLFAWENFTNFTNVSREASTRRSQKRHWLDCLFALLVSACVKAAKSISYVQLICLREGVNFTNVSWEASFSQRRQKTPLTWQSFCAFGICMRKSCA